MPLGAWLLAMMQPLVARVMVALGLSVVSVVGLDVVISGLKGQVIGYLGQVPAAGLNLALLAGAGEALGIIFGAITTRIALEAIRNGTKFLGFNT